MDSQQLVLDQHPDAVLVEVPPVAHRSSGVALKPGYFVIYADNRLDADELGRGVTHQATWDAAARKLEPAVPVGALQASAKR
jgi:hypothetical protein